MRAFRLLCLCVLSCLLPLAGLGQGQGSAAARMEAMGLVDIAEEDSAIRIELIYATADNFTGTVLYGDLERAFLQPEVAAKLVRARRILQDLRPDLTFLVYDAARPLSVQRRMWAVVKGTANQRYVSNPANGGGLHNYGAAVDVTLCDLNGSPLPMGTPYDFFGPEAHIDQEGALVAAGKITAQEAENRQLLRSVMRLAGFISLKSEWWHFNSLSRAEAKERYPLIE